MGLGFVPIESPVDERPAVFEDEPTDQADVSSIKTSNVLESPTAETA